MKHLVVIAVLALVLPQGASAVPFLKGKIVSSGASKNNLTTVASFTIPNGPVSVLCDADVYFAAGPTSVTAATSDGFPLTANAEKTMTAVNGGNVFAILPVSGSATCKVFQLNGETISYRSPGGGGSQCGVTQSCAASSYSSTITDGTAGFTCSGYGQCVQGPSSCSGFAVDSSTGYMYLGGIACAPVVRLGDTILLQQGQISVAGQLNMNGAAARIRMDRAALLACGVDVTEGTTMIDGTSGGTTTHRTRECLCTSDGGPTPVYAWQNKLSGSIGTATTCPS